MGYRILTKSHLPIYNSKNDGRHFRVYHRFINSVLSEVLAVGIYEGVNSISIIDC